MSETVTPASLPDIASDISSSIASGEAPFRVVSDFDPAGDQPAAVARLAEGLDAGERFQTLLGITGSGKSATIAWLIEQVQKPTLVLAPNKALAAQLANEFRQFFPENRVEYFVSYYDYYQPEAYLPQTDTFIEKDATVNDEIDRLRHAATSGLLVRDDVVIVASVSAIYGLGTPEQYSGQLLRLVKGVEYPLSDAIRRLVDIQYERNEINLVRGKFRLKGDTLEVFPTYEEYIYRVEYFGDEIERISRFDLLRGDNVEELERISIYPKTHYVTPQEELERAMGSIERELEDRLTTLETSERLLERQRLEQRTRFDLEMLREIGYCHGIENYSRHLTGRGAGDPPPTLLDYLPSDYLLVVDESHQTIPQVRGMYHGDRSRKETLVDHGFRLPSALDNRPLTFEEFDARTGQRLLISATPGPWELSQVEGVVVEQVVRPTGLLDPEIVVRPAKGQIDDLIAEIGRVVDVKNRVLVTTLTKRMAEELTQYLLELGVRVRYLHSDIDTLERVEIVTALRQGMFDVLVGINLLREGLDLPEVALVAVLDADKEGFLRSETALIQTAGRAARNLEGRVLFYGDKVTKSMRRAIEETERRRERQHAYNQEHGIEPRTILKDIYSPLVQMSNLDYHSSSDQVLSDLAEGNLSLNEQIDRLEKRMRKAAKRLEFEEAAALRDRLRELRELQVYSS